ncbi:MAG: ribonuclease HII [Ignavibacteriales bacterium]|nr:ribonuclease HII [Ignavibacteriales bacterium]HOJ19107.1 ribonuclease HII [Ignavibacteriaceae bacterium]HPO54626.1 ribonuclease HII [Ignavibacteriaceae bacterium]
MKKFDDGYRVNGIKLIAGVDEAGRGPLAGPVVAAAVILPVDYNNRRIKDSKKLSASMRGKLSEEIKQIALAYSYSVVSHGVIDKINILQATMRAMEEAVNNLAITPEFILVDGNKTYKNDPKIKTVIKGDGLSLTIAAASIIAKVVRDSIMLELDCTYPDYKWKQNKGYPTKDHIESIKKFGITEYHRKTFLTRILEGEKSND